MKLKYLFKKIRQALPSLNGEADGSNPPAQQDSSFISFPCVAASTSFKQPLHSSSTSSLTNWAHPEDPRFRNPVSFERFEASPSCAIQRALPNFKLWNVSRKALLIGINYPNSTFPLRGCVTDVEAIRTMLISRFHFPEAKIRVLTDQNEDPEFHPTKKNILKDMQWLVDQAMPGDSLFLHFSGHGYQVEDVSGDELDGYDEAILPCDFETEGWILDDVLYEILVRPLKEGVRLMVVFDSCHSGTALDLPYIYLPTGEIHHPLQYKSIKGWLSRLKIMNFQSTLSLGAKSPKDQTRLTIWNLFKYFQIKKHLKRNKELFTSKAEVIMLSACQDFQTSADTIIQGQARGVMSWALLEALSDPSVVTYADILFYTQSLLSKKFNQTPQLSSGKPIDMYLPFAI